MTIEIGRKSRFSVRLLSEVFHLAKPVHQSRLSYVSRSHNFQAHIELELEPGIAAGRSKGTGTAHIELEFELGIV